VTHLGAAIQYKSTDSYTCVQDHHTDLS